MIYESGIVTATTADLLSGGRLNAIPYGGTLTIELLADLNSATNNYAVTIQKPNGDVPIDAQVVPGSNPSLGGLLGERQLPRMSVRAKPGRHFTVTRTGAGTALCNWRAVLSP